jgi:3-dehydroquinate synthase
MGSRCPSPFRLPVSVSAHARYDVLVGPGVLAEIGRYLNERVAGARPFVLTDERVGALYRARLDEALRAGGHDPVWLTIPDGERSKSLETFGRLLVELGEKGADRRAALVNFGGGVICDLGGFVASAYMRGIRYVNVATSLIAQLDASIGGKVAVNTAAAKNVVGAFHHPSLVVNDPDLLATLSDRDLLSGVAEAIKVAIIASPELFSFLSASHAAIRARDPAALARLVADAARIKMELVAPDPLERDLRRSLNFGHTIGHAIETEFGYGCIRHGEAVAVGMGIATALARTRGRISAADAEAIFELLHAYDLDRLLPDFPAARVVERLAMIRLIRGNLLCYVMPTRIGAVEFTEEVSESDLAAALADRRAVLETERDGAAART